MNIKNRRAFTLAEMMVVLLVLSLVMTAFLPVITKRSKVASSAGGIWQYMSNNSDVFSQTGATQVAAIGISSTAPTDNTKLLINTSSADQNNILFKQNNTEIGKLIITGGIAGSTYGTNDVGLGAVTLPAAASGNATAVGYNAKATANLATAVGATSSAGDSSSVFGYGATANGAGVAVGDGATGTGDHATAVGFGAHATTTDSVALGNGTTANNSTTTAAGAGAQAAGIASTALGWGANATADYTTAVGRSSTAKNDSIAIGYYANAENASLTAGRSSTALSNGVALGYGTNAGPSSTTLGYGSGAKGSYDTSLGENVQIADTYNYSTAIGYNAAATSSNQIVMGTGAETVYIPGKLTVDKTVTFTTLSGSGTVTVASGVLSYTSDRRLKDISGEFTGGLDKIRELKTYKFTFKKDKIKTPHVGVMAQDLQKVFPDAVTTDDNGFLMIRQDDMFYAMINSIKQLDELVQGVVRDVKALIGRVQQLESKVLSLVRDVQSNSQKIKSLENQNKSLESRITRLEKTIKK